MYVTISQHGDFSIIKLGCYSFVKSIFVVVAKVIITYENCRKDLNIFK